MLKSKKMFYLAMSLLFLLIRVSELFAQQPQIIAKLNAHTLGIHYSETDRYQLYSVIDSNEIVLAVDKTLIFIKNNRVKKKILSPAHIFAFDISKLGNGIIVSRSGLYKIKEFQIQSCPISAIIENPKEGKIIWQIDMINDTIARFVVNDTKALFYIDIDNIECNNYIVKEDVASQFIGEKASSTYVGQYKNEYYFLMYDIKEQSEYLAIRSNLKKDDLADERIFKFGNLGQSADESVPIRCDEENNLFYEMLFKDNEMVLYRFDMKDYQ
jgi:hypothetical protein